MTPCQASISKKLDASVFISGSINHAGTSIRVNVQLTDSKTEEVFKSFQIEAPSKEEKIFQILDSLSVELQNFLIISELKKKESHEAQKVVYSYSPEAYRYFIYGKNAFNKRDYTRARNMFSQALAIDSNFTAAIMYLSVAYGNQTLYEQAKKWCFKAYEKRDRMTVYEKLYTNWLYATYFETPHEEIENIRQLIEIDDQLPMAYYVLGNSYMELQQYNKAIPEYEKALEIRNKWGLKITWVYSYTSLGIAYHETGQFKKEKELYKKAELDFPDDPEIIRRQAILSLTEGETNTANEYIKRFISVRKENSVPEASIMTSLAYIYYTAGISNKAEEYYREAIELEPENPDRMSNLAWFLIDNNQKIGEGLKLINEALEMSPDNYNYLHTKGWGLFKQGNIKEALDLLEQSWALKPVYDHEIYLHIQEVKKAIADNK